MLKLNLNFNSVTPSEEQLEYLAKNIVHRVLQRAEEIYARNQQQKQQQQRLDTKEISDVVQEKDEIALQALARAWLERHQVSACARRIQRVARQGSIAV